MELNISPLDNRYKDKANQLRPFVSDFGLNKIRTEIELRYFSFFLKRVFNVNINLDNIIEDFSLDDLALIKNIESKTNHDVKSIEYFLKDKIQSYDVAKKYSEFIHFGLTSQDINSLANILIIKNSLNNVLIPTLEKIIQILDVYGNIWRTNVMISKTHGQPAVTTSMGKELRVFSERIKKQLNQLIDYNYSTKFGGAVGNLNAHYFCYESIDWDKEFDTFLETFGVKRHRLTTQIDHYDNLSEVFDIIKRINIILIDLNQDIWLYISQNYFTLKRKKGEVGSSTMPHKINPINFENSEGNLYVANSLLRMMSDKLPISRLQRDLTDSTITRNIGVALSHCLISYDSLLSGLGKIEINYDTINKDIEGNWAILMEPVQCIMKTEMIPNAYEFTKDISRGNVVTKDIYLDIVDNLDLSQRNKTKLLNLTPASYIGNLLMN